MFMQKNSIFFSAFWFKTFAFAGVKRKDWLIKIVLACGWRHITECNFPSLANTKPDDRSLLSTSLKDILTVVVKFSISNSWIVLLKLTGICIYFFIYLFKPWKQWINLMHVEQNFWATFIWKTSFIHNFKSTSKIFWNNLKYI